MEDDDLADCAQRLLDALDATVRDAKLVAQLDPDDLKSIRANRDRVFIALAGYRNLSYFTERRSARPRRVSAGTRRSVLAPMAISATLAIPMELAGGTAVAGGTGSGALLAIGGALLPIAIAAGAAVAVSRLTGGSLQDSAARHLTDAVNDLARSLLELDAVSTVMAITAEEAAALSPEELLEKLTRAAKAGAGATSQIILEELVRRFPGCYGALEKVRAAFDRLRRVKANPTLGGRIGRLIPGAQTQLDDALDALKSCVAS